MLTWHAMVDDAQDVKAVAWHPKGEILVSCSYDDTVKLWRESDDEWICEQTLSGVPHQPFLDVLETLSPFSIGIPCDPSTSGCKRAIAAATGLTTG